MALTAVAAMVLLGGRANAGPSRQLLTLGWATTASNGAQAAPAFLSNGLLAAAAANGSQSAPSPAPGAAPAATAAATSPAGTATATAPATTAAARSLAAARSASLGLPLPLRYLRGGSVDQGVDYTAPGGTPLYAMGPGVIIAEGGIAGFGPNTPVLLITAGPLAGRTVYYGHAGPNVVRVGALVVAGQQIGVVGSGIVGLSTGPHLEVGFYPLTGNMGAGVAMMAYINGLVGHRT
jgi:murein DD-endopeptidase MepM/ murein hydrolase activator NlpD